MVYELRLLADTHIAKQIAIQLRDKGVNVIRLEELVDLSNDASDNEILEYAIANERAVVSLDDDFRTLHYQYLAENKSHRGIFLGNRHLQGNIGFLVTFFMGYADYVEDMSLIENDLILIE